MRPIRPIFPRLLLLFLSFQLSTFSFLFAATTRLGDVSATGAFTLQTGGSFVALTGSTVDLSACTLTAPADFTRLGSSISLTSEISGILPVANGGTGTATPALIAGSGVTITGMWPNQTIASTGSGSGGSASPTTAEGDLIVRGASADQRLGVGSNGQVLIVDTTQSGKLKWATAGGGGSGGGLVSPPTQPNSTGAAGSLAVSADLTTAYLCVADNSWKQFSLAAVPGASTYVATYASDGDANGVFTFLGKNLQTAGSWVNPHTLGTLVVSTSAELGGQGGVEVLVDHASSHFHTTNTANSWIGFDVGPNRTVVADKWSFRYRDNSTGDSPLGLALKGSNDNSNFTTINLQAGLTVAADGWLTFTLTASPAGYRYFRIYLNGANSSGGQYVTCGEVEIYGTLSYYP